MKTHAELNAVSEGSKSIFRVKVAKRFTVRVVSYGRTLLKIRSYCCVNWCFCMIRSTCKIFTLPIVPYFRCFVISYGTFFPLRTEKMLSAPLNFFLKGHDFVDLVSS